MEASLLIADQCFDYREQVNPRRDDTRLENGKVGMSARNRGRKQLCGIRDRLTEQWAADAIQAFTFSRQCARPNGPALFRLGVFNVGQCDMPLAKSASVEPSRTGMVQAQLELIDFFLG